MSLFAVVLGTMQTSPGPVPPPTVIVQRVRLVLRFLVVTLVSGVAALIAQLIYVAGADCAHPPGGGESVSAVCLAPGLNWPLILIVGLSTGIGSWIVSGNILGEAPDPLGEKG